MTRAKVTATGQTNTMTNKQTNKQTIETYNIDIQNQFFIQIQCSPLLPAQEDESRPSLKWTVAQKWTIFSQPDGHLHENVQ